MFLEGPACFYPKGMGPQHPNIFQTSCIHPYSVTNSNQFCMVIKLDKSNTFTRLTTPRPWPKIFGIQMLMRNLFAVANLVNSHHRSGQVAEQSTYINSCIISDAQENLP